MNMYSLTSFYNRTHTSIYELFADIVASVKISIVRITE